jgi:hypothetical protein
VPRHDRNFFDLHIRVIRVQKKSRHRRDPDLYTYKILIKIILPSKHIQSYSRRHQRSIAFATYPFDLIIAVL